MIPVLIAILGLIFLFAGMRIGIAMALVGFLGIMYMRIAGGFTVVKAFTMALGAFANGPFASTNKDSLVVIPMFTLMGVTCAKAGISQDLYAACYKWVSRARGGLAIATKGQVDFNIGCSAYALMANTDIWGALPADIQSAIKSASGDYLLNLVDIWSFWEAAGRYGAVKNGGEIYAPSDAFAEQLQTAYENVDTTWISEQADPAVAQRIYEEAQKLVEKYNSEFNW